MHASRRSSSAKETRLPSVEEIAHAPTPTEMTRPPTSTTRTPTTGLWLKGIYDAVADLNTPNTGADTPNTNPTTDALQPSMPDTWLELDIPNSAPLTSRPEPFSTYTPDTTVRFRLTCPSCLDAGCWSCRAMPHLEPRPNWQTYICENCRDDGHPCMNCQPRVFPSDLPFRPASFVPRSGLVDIDVEARLAEFRAMMS